jgi:fucose permease
MGLLINMHFLGSFFLPFVFGRLSDRYTKKVILIIAYLIFLVGLIMILATKSTIVLAVSIFIIGGGFAALEGVGTAILADTNHDSSRAINLSQAFFCGGAAIGPIASEKLILLTGDYKTVYITFVVIIVCMAIASMIVMPVNRFNRLTVQPSQVKTLLNSAVLWLMIFIMIIYVGIEAGYAFWTTTFIQQQSELSGSGYLALSSYWLAMGIGRLLASRVKRKQLIISTISIVCSIPIVIMLTQFRLDLAGMLLYFSLIGFFLSSLWPVIMFQAAKAFPDRTGTALGYMMSASALGGAAIPLAVGIITEFYSIKYAFYTLMICSALLVVMMITLHQGMKKNKTADYTF